MKGNKVCEGECASFHMPYYIIKFGKIWVKTYKWIHFVENEMLTCDLTIS